MSDQFKPHWYGDYELIKPLGVGGMAEVFLARTTGVQGFEKQVVVKRMLARHARNPRVARMFVDEAKVAVRLQHANIVQILSLDEHEDRPFIVMEHVHGKDLYEVLYQSYEQGFDLPVDFGLHCLVETLKGLGHAHNACGADGEPANLIHRDVTPSNIFVSFEGEVKLGDFGIAHSVNAVDAAELRGKLGYLAPEAVYGKKLDPRSDLFSAGVVLWEVLSLRRLYMGDSDTEVMARIRDETPDKPSRYNPRVPPDLDAIAAKALAKSPSKRFQSASEFEETLTDFLYARRQRWTRRRIVEVMQTLFTGQTRPLVLPPPSPRSERDPFGGPALNQADETTRKLTLAMDGLEQTPTLPPEASAESMAGWADRIESAFGTVQVPDTAIDVTGGGGADEDKTQTDLVLCYLPEQRVPLSKAIEELIDQLSAQPCAVEALGVIGGAPVPVAEVGRLLFWDTLRGLDDPTGEPAVDGTFAEVSLTRLLYEFTIRRMNGLVVFEDGASSARRFLYLDAGYPRYVSSDRPQDGAPVMVLRHNLVPSKVLFMAVARGLEHGQHLDQALVHIMGEAERKRLERSIAAIIRSRLYEMFKWSDGRFRVYPDARPPSSPRRRLPTVMGILSRAVWRSRPLSSLQRALDRLGDTPLVISAARQQHVTALRFKEVEDRVVRCIDGARTPKQIVSAAEARNQEELRRALAAVYVLTETRVAVAPGASR